MSSKNVNGDSKSDKHQTPKSKINNIHKQSPFRNSPNFSTPPSRFTKVFNPFEANLLERLHLPMCSPNMFRQISTPKTEEKFAWTIEDISIFNPADIDETTNSQHVLDEEDPQIESMMQEKITKFFSENQVVPSPLNVKVGAICMVRSLEATPDRDLDALESYFNKVEDQQCTEVSMKDALLYKELFEFEDDEPKPDEVQLSLSPPSPISGDFDIPAIPFASTTRGSGSPLELKKCTISPVTKTSPTRFSDDMDIDISMFAPSDKENQPMSTTVTPVKKTDTTFAKQLDCRMEYKQVSVSFSPSPDSNKMDASNSNTPRAKLFIGKGQRKRLSKSFINEFASEHVMLEKNTTDVGYCTRDTADNSNNYTNVFASTPSKRNAILRL